MAFKSNAQRSAYFEQLRKNGQMGMSPKAPALGLPPAQHMNQIAASPALPAVMPPKSNQPNMTSLPATGNMAPNPMQPLNPAGGNKFGRLKRFM
jgi:hypothetical protein